jgi:hypothetical protein
VQAVAFSTFSSKTTPDAADADDTSGASVFGELAWAMCSDTFPRDEIPSLLAQLPTRRVMVFHGALHLQLLAVIHDQPVPLLMVRQWSAAAWGKEVQRRLVRSSDGGVHAPDMSSVQQPVASYFEAASKGEADVGSDGEHPSLQLVFPVDYPTQLLHDLLRLYGLTSLHAVWMLNPLLAFT